MKKKEQTGNSTGTGENRCLIQTSKKKKLSFGLHKANLKTKKKTSKENGFILPRASQINQDGREIMHMTTMERRKKKKEYSLKTKQK